MASDGVAFLISMVACSVAARGSRVSAGRLLAIVNSLAILDTAMRLASIEGVEGLSFGQFARELDITKSGVFARFRDKQHLQRETIDAALEVFEREVVAPGTAAPPGRARLEALCEATLSYIERDVFPGGCFLAQLLADYDARQCPIRDELAGGQRGWLGLLTCTSCSVTPSSSNAPGPP